MLAHRDQLDVTVVRPAVIESALRDPFPGWNQGVNTSAPLTYLAGRGYRFYPAKAELVLDVIPVDLAAHAMIPILGALLSRKQKPIYQLCTSDRNPLPMRRLVELTALSNRREHRKEGGTMRWLGPHLEAVVVSQNTYDLASEKLPKLLKQAAAFARSVVGEENQRAKKIESEIAKFKENTDLARELVEVYRPYIQELVYTFHASNIRALYATLKPADAEHHPFRPDLIDWHDYWINIHLPGLRRHIFPQLDLHTRARAQDACRVIAASSRCSIVRRKITARVAMKRVGLRRAHPRRFPRIARPRPAGGPSAAYARDQARRPRPSDRWARISPRTGCSAIFSRFYQQHAIARLDPARSQQQCRAMRAVAQLAIRRLRLLALGRRAIIELCAP